MNTNDETQHTDPEVAHAHAVAGELRVVLGKLKRRLREEASLGEFTLSQMSALSR
ncbi:MAG: Transcriptional regulator, MarR family, partial [Caballeronia sp.]|nr:Transcriptional regulator, MarR family [Caballeronia sp.]